MASRLKEDERNERTIRNLLKLPENKRCINCNSLGPQYVCTNFSTFVCTTCSGIHREFTHRVKSISMAKFSSLEVSALQGGGNASAKEIYFKEWDPQRNSFPDSSNVEKLRDFIKHVYVDRRYSGERSFDKPPRGKMGEADDSNETRRIDAYQGGSRSPPYEDTYERRYGERPSPGGRSDDRSSKNSYDERRSPGYDQDNRQYGDYRKSPARTEVITDWRREDRFGDGRRSEDNKISDGGSKIEGRSPDRQRDLDISSPPVVRPVREILGESVSPLRIIEPPKVNGAKTQRTASSSSLASTNENPTELRTESSLIDFDAIPEPSSTAPVPQPQQTSPGPSLAQPTASSNDNWANFGPAPEVKVSQAPSNANLLDVLSELSVPASLPTHTSLPGGSTSLTVPVGSNLSSSHNLPITSMGTTQMSPFGTLPSVSAPISHPMTYLPGSAVGPAHVPASSFVNAADAGQWQGVHGHQQFVPATGSQPPQSFTQAVGATISNQPWIGNTPNTTVVQSPVTSGVATSVDVRPTIKKELPEDLFASKYSPFPAAGPGWYVTPQYGVQLNMPYNMAAAAQPMPTFPQPSKSSNPFDVHPEPTLVQSTSFPSMATLQGALPNMAAPTGILRTSSLPPAWTPHQSSYPLTMPPQGPSYGSSVPPGPYMGQAPPNMPPRPQGVGSFGSLNPSQQQSGLYSAPTNTNGFPAVGGNPFG